MRTASWILGLIFCLTAFPVEATGNAEQGKREFARCRGCHPLEVGRNAAGPNLLGVVGRRAGSARGYSYSPAIQAAAEKGLIWSEPLIAEYIASPLAFLTNYTGETLRTKGCTIFPVKDKEMRDRIAAYLLSLAPLE